jgi:hypothetical protein
MGSGRWTRGSTCKSHSPKNRALVLTAAAQEFASGSKTYGTRAGRGGRAKNGYRCRSSGGGYSARTIV